MFPNQLVVSALLALTACSSSIGYEDVLITSSQRLRRSLCECEPSRAICERSCPDVLEERVEDWFAEATVVVNDCSAAIGVEGYTPASSDVEEAYYAL